MEKPLHTLYRGQLRPAKVRLRLNGRSFVAYGVESEGKGYKAFEVELLVQAPDEAEGQERGQE